MAANDDDQGKLEIAVRVLGNELVALKMVVDDFKMKWLVIGVFTIVSLFWAATCRSVVWFVELCLCAWRYVSHAHQAGTSSIPKFDF